MKRKKVGLIQVKEALRDSRFRDRLPESMKKQVVEYLQNPGCLCNIPLYRKILRDYTPLLEEYFPDKEVSSEQEEIDKLAENHWSVINCHVNELEDRLRQLPGGRKQLAITRYIDQVTVVVNELDILY